MKRRILPTDPIFYVYLKFDFGGIPRWVGKGKGRRAFDHERFREKHWNYQMRALVLEANKKGCSLPTVFLREGLTEPEAFDLERFWIAVIGRGDDGPLYNWTDGGEGVSGLVHTPENIERYRALMFDPEHKAKLKRGLDGMSPEARAARSERQRLAKLGTKQTDDHRRKIGAGQPKTRPPEFGRLVSAAKMGHEVTAETRAKVSASKQANPRRLSEAEKAHLSRVNIGRTYSPEVMAKYKATWANPEIRERRRQGQRARWARRRAVPAEGESSR